MDADAERRRKEAEKSRLDAESRSALDADAEKSMQDAGSRSALQMHAKDALQLLSLGSDPPIDVDALAKDPKATAELLLDALRRCNALEQKQKSADATLHPLMQLQSRRLHWS
jgi:hypothetical protein